MKMEAKRIYTNKFTTMDPEARFWSYVDKSAGPDGCWIWKGSRMLSGYGRFGLGNGKYYRAHRMAYEMIKGAIPKGLALDHLCRNKICVNPGHLEPVTPVENVLRAVRLITHCKQGHPFEGDNLAYDKRGWRKCRICLRNNDRRHKAKVRSQN